MQPAVPLYQVDAFTAVPFAGNPAAVCLLEAPAAGEWMQAVAAEMNLSETAFLVPRDDGYDLRWFTPQVEVDLCGHATLASAHVLFETGRLPEAGEARFHTRSGLLTCRRHDGWIAMDFPATPIEDVAASPALLDALGIRHAAYIGWAKWDPFIVLDSEGQVRDLAPEMTRLASASARGVIVTAPSGSPGYDFVSRFFAPAAGIPEDPVTGSAHCALGPYWSERLGKPILTGYQASRRGGVVQVEPTGDRVTLRGQAVTVLSGTLAAPDAGR